MKRVREALHRWSRNRAIDKAEKELRDMIRTYGQDHELTQHAWRHRDLLVWGSSTQMRASEQTP